MVWTNPPLLVTNFRDLLLACPTIGTTLGIVAAGVHYPSADPTSDTLPCLVIDPGDLEGERSTVGGSVVIADMEATLLLPNALDVGTIEGYRYSIARELVEWTTEALAVIRSRVSRAQLPSPGMQAASDAGQPDTGAAYKGLIIRAWFEG
jgi:hypothetical protein